MNCDVSQRRLLALPEPADPPPALREHLEVCPHCQEMQRRLVQVERNVPLLPVPASTARADFLERFRSEGTVAEKVLFHLREVKRLRAAQEAPSHTEAREGGVDSDRASHLGNEAAQVRNRAPGRSWTKMFSEEQSRSRLRDRP